MPPVQGDTIARQALLNAAGERYPRMLTSPTTMVWHTSSSSTLTRRCRLDQVAELRDFVRNDLNSVEKGVWKVVVPSAALYQQPQAPA
ncbi:MAG: hypothetical protein IPI39_25110 [Candidatus Obscuribacter sp.]|nr:hypothetical protein [Candidatus Obscuribacter sp.]